MLSPYYVPLDAIVYSTVKTRKHIAALQLSDRRVASSQSPNVYWCTEIEPQTRFTSSRSAEASAHAELSPQLNLKAQFLPRLRSLLLGLIAVLATAVSRNAKFCAHGIISTLGSG